ncbi:sensor histidine kinase [Adhaeribacter aquaticus]|uniref:sensor histidine kinase n=1 Tax=Adhaeribacter aquaticus TaxID=299567 RepID=UPI0003FCA084|nr:HAMP domain-containing sensor histidine kinase [Adhaeribacter aquaticus]
MIPNLLEQIDKSSSEIFFLYNLSTGKFDYLSQALESVWEEKKEDILISPSLLLSRIHPDDLEAVKMRFDKVCKGSVSKLEFDLKFSKEKEKRIRLDAYPIEDEKGQVKAIAGKAEDVSQQAQYLEYLLEFGRKKNNVLQIIAHDLQSPLAIVKGVSGLLELDHHTKAYEEVENYINILNRAYEDCLNLINDVLNDEHISSVAIAVNKERFDIVNKVTEVAETFYKSKIIKTAIEIKGPNDKIIGELDPIKFVQIMNNLITNSIKFTPPEGKISIAVEQQESKLIITHSDTGIGIPKELHPYLFNKKDKKAMRPGLNGEQPNGVGLSIIQDLVELQGGNITFESEENKGTTFYLTFPVLDF